MGRAALDAKNGQFLGSERVLPATSPTPRTTPRAVGGNSAAGPAPSTTGRFSIPLTRTVFEPHNFCLYIIEMQHNWLMKHYIRLMFKTNVLVCVLAVPRAEDGGGK